MKDEKYAFLANWTYGAIDRFRTDANVYHSVSVNMCKRTSENV